MAAAWEGAPARAEKRQQIRRALPALQAEPYGQVAIALSVFCRGAAQLLYATAGL
jgi:hypothetical protein